MSRPWLTPETTRLDTAKLLGVSCSGLLGGCVTPYPRTPRLRLHFVTDLPPKRMIGDAASLLWDLGVRRCTLERSLEYFRGLRWICLDDLAVEKHAFRAELKDYLR